MILRATPAAVLLAACGPAPSGGGPDGAGPQPAGQPMRGGTFTVAMARDVVNFDPTRQSDVYSAMVLNNTVDTLFEVDRDGNVVGRLVEKTENPQPNVYVFTLRKGIKFHDGTDLNAEAVKFNLERHVNDPRSVRSQDVKDITSIETPDAHTVRITLKVPFAPFPVKLTFGAGFVLSPTAVQKLGESLQRDLTGAGSGAFKFVEWQKDTSVTLERNPSYWRKDADGDPLPYLDRIIYKPFPDENVRLTNVRTGDADALASNPPYKDAAELRRSAELDVKELAGIGYTLMMLNTEREPFNHPAARRAFSYAVDRAQIRQTVYYDNGKLLDTPMPETVAWAHDKSLQQYHKRDVAKARQELAAAGKPNGFKFTIQATNASPEVQQAMELIKDQIKDAGLDMEIQLIEFATVLTNGQAGNFQAIGGIGWSGDVDPDTLYALFHTGAGFNYPRYSNPQVDRLLDDGRQTIDRARRAEAYKQVQRLLYEDQPMLIYFNAPQISTVRKSVQNYPQTFNGYWGSRDYDKVWKTK
jgi:peptide/nickel transport system substrate-binding protein